MLVSKNAVSNRYYYGSISAAGWPSGLRRQTQEIALLSILVHECVRGFESHSCQIFLCFLITSNDTRKDQIYRRSIMVLQNSKILHKKEAVDRKSKATQSVEN